MNIELFLLYLSLSSALLVLFFPKKGLAFLFLAKYSSGIDQKFNEVQLLKSQAEETLDRAKQELERSMEGQKKREELCLKEMEDYLEDRVKDAKKISQAKIALADTLLKRERFLGFKRAEDSLRMDIKTSISSAIINKDKPV